MGRDSYAVPTHALLHDIHRQGVGDERLFVSFCSPFCSRSPWSFSFVVSLVRICSFLGQAWGKGSLQQASARGLWIGNGLYVRLP